MNYEPDGWEMLEMAVFFFVGVCICLILINGCSEMGNDDVVCHRDQYGDYWCDE